LRTSPGFAVFRPVTCVFFPQFPFTDVHPLCTYKRKY
jgi:hypothetical protein